MTGVGWLLCRLGRHDREYLIGHNDLVVVWCPRRQNPKVAEVLNRTSAMLDEASMAEMNYKVDGEKMEPKDVAKDFLKSKGVVK